ncbi:lmo0937 family membrane protein [Halalkalibacter alkalisediminis]|uniref:Lmo0937 family membrane protein n=1 Tax=Halalkalibacter alkalisediminis TaxID=935616 RepID=A0ABV6NBB7_9BACI|nr:lmo0937 family membrane protein [Halalkalibacter alkalisediminis]
MWTLLIILFILWLLGFSFEIAGNLIHLLLVIALVVLIIRLVTGRKV